MRAYTSGDHVVLGSAGVDEHTLAHELTHVVQQRSGPVAGTDNGQGLRISDPGDRFEREAELNATRVLSGNPQAPETPVGTTNAMRGTGAAVVQRVRRNDMLGIYKQWQNTDSVDKQLLGPMWTALVAAAKNSGTDLTKLTKQEAAQLLVNANVTLDELKVAGQQLTEASTPVQQGGESVVEQARKAWAAHLSDQIEVEHVAFDVPHLGAGEFALIRGRSGKPAQPGMLAFFAHGYEQQGTIDVSTARSYGFAVSQRKSLFRLADADVYASLPPAMTAQQIPATTAAPKLYVRPHAVGELGLELAGMMGLIGQCDVAILLDFRWANDLGDEFAEAKSSDTPPMAPLVDGTPSLRQYSSLLLFTCRTPWAVDAAVAGSSRLREEVAKRVNAEAKDKGWGEDDVRKRVDAEVMSAPQKATVYPA